ncbi:hypothetical protein E2C01_088434 [Portunus trituberculatus]|uniref:Uncharacterized protein n=1 Tax=Portunus trituberculatus TaxID=210409 RepID=A0A5B7J987_PORTR|nr:hypothetical protein [Portunus trituberculatus]
MEVSRVLEPAGTLYESKNIFERLAKASRVARQPLKGSTTTALMSQQRCTACLPLCNPLPGCRSLGLPPVLSSCHAFDSLLLYSLCLSSEC